MLGWPVGWPCGVPRARCSGSPGRVVGLVVCGLRLRRFLAGLRAGLPPFSLGFSPLAVFSLFREAALCFPVGTTLGRFTVDPFSVGFCCVDAGRLFFVLIGFDLPRVGGPGTTIRSHPAFGRMASYGIFLTR